MKTLTNRHHWNEVIFENRNKLYGAYELRATYEQRVKRSLLLCFAFVTIITGLPAAIAHFFTNTIEQHADPDIYAPIPFDPSATPPPPAPVQPKQQRPKQTNHYYIVDRDSTPAPIDTLKDEPEINTPAGNNTAGGDVPGEGTAEVPPTGSVPVVAPAVHQPWQVDKMPEFPGGMNAFYKFINARVKYPIAARENNVSGSLYVSFVIDASGNVKSIKLLRGLGYGFDEAVTGALEKMPAWKPGTAHGEAVSIQMQLPVKFALE